MTRVKGGVTANKRRRNVLRAAKGYRFWRSTHERYAKVALVKAGVSAFRDRRDKKNVFRQLWIVRLNAALHPMGISYSKFIGGLKKKGITVDRKILSTIAKDHPESFERFVKQIS